MADLKAVPQVNQRMRLLGEEEGMMVPEETPASEHGNLEDKMAALRKAQADTDAHMANAKNKVTWC